MDSQIIREPVAIGRFYPQNKEQIAEVVPAYFAKVRPQIKDKPAQPWAVLLPHAGYFYCGEVLAATLTDLELPETIMLICPNHTGRGKAFGVWPNGSWKMPLGFFPVDEEIVQILTRGGLFESDYISHLGEHSIEVLLPFIYYACGQKIPKIVPICVGTHDPKRLARAAGNLVSVWQNLSHAGKKLGLIISSDMNHFESHEVCMKKDALALERILAGDPDGLLAVCSKEKITMCGVGPCALSLYAAKILGNFSSRLISHTTSAEASGNFNQTVGYAGLHFFLDQAS